MKVWSKCASISVTITDIKTKFGIEHKYHTTNMPEWPNSHKLKIQDGGGRHLKFRKNVNTLDWIKISCIKLYAKMHHGDAELTTGPKVETGSQFTWRHQIYVWSICASISVTITDIWTKFSTEHKYHTTNSMKWPNSYKLKIQDGGGRHLEFRKNVNNFELDKDILHQIIWEDAWTTATRRWPRDQKSKPEVNSRDVIKWMSEAYVRRSQWL